MARRLMRRVDSRRDWFAICETWRDSRCDSSAMPVRLSPMLCHVRGRFGWRAENASDVAGFYEPEVGIYCPDCWEREFGDGA